MTRELSRVVRRLSGQTSRRLADIPASPMFFATVTAVAPLTVSWRGGSVVARSRGASYTPLVGHRVLCVLVSNQLVVLDAMTD